MEVLTRRLTDLEVRSDPERIVATLSTEEPVERHFGREVLVHSEGSIDMARAMEGLPLLWAHHPEQIVGRVENVRLSNKRLRGELRPGNTTFAKEVWEDIRAKVVTDLSIGYTVDDSSAKREGDVVRFFRWMPYEVSALAIGADRHAKIGRGLALSGESTMSNDDSNSNVNINEKPGGEKRVREILAMGEGFNGRFMKEAVQAVKNGDTAERFRSFMLSKLDNAVPVDTPFSDGRIGLTPNEVRKYSFARAIHAMASRDFSAAGFEAECSRAAAKIRGREPEGFYVPVDVLSSRREGQRSLASTPDTAGGYMIGTDHLASEFVELLRARMMVITLGARVLTGLRGNVDIPTQTGAATEYWLGEDEAITPSDQTFGSVNLTPHTCGGLTRFTRRMLLQSSPDVESLVQADLAAVVAGGVDKVAINGGGSNQPDGILVVSGVAPITTSGTLTWAKILEFPAAIETANADVGSLAFLTNAATKSRLLSTAKETGFPVYLWEFAADGSGRVAGERAFSSNNVPANLGVGTDKSAIIFGNWNDLLIGQWGSLDLLSDPYTDMNKGAIRVRAFMDVDIGIRHPASFAAAQDV